jgi:hypothetical protein
LPVQQRPARPRIMSSTASCADYMLSQRMPSPQISEEGTACTHTVHPSDTAPRSNRGTVRHLPCVQPDRNPCRSRPTATSPPSGLLHGPHTGVTGMSPIACANSPPDQTGRIVQQTHAVGPRHPGTPGSGPPVTCEPTAKENGNPDRYPRQRTQQTRQSNCTHPSARGGRHPKQGDQPAASCQLVPMGQTVLHRPCV